MDLIFKAGRRLLRSHVYVKYTSGGTEHQIDSDDLFTASGARWTPDGKKLLILAGVGAPAMSALNRTSLQLYSVALTRIDEDPMANGIDTEAEAEAAAAETPRRGAVDHEARRKNRMGWNSAAHPSTGSYGRLSGWHDYRAPIAAHML